MDVKEKLVELIESARYCGSNTSEEIAKNLLENGVTVQEWIPVNERLPENFISVLGYMTDAGEFPLVRECYTVGNVFSSQHLVIYIQYRIGAKCHSRRKEND